MGLKLLRNLQTHKNLEGEDCITVPRTQLVTFKKGDVIKPGDINEATYAKLVEKGYAVEEEAPKKAAAPKTEALKENKKTDKKKEK